MNPKFNFFGCPDWFFFKPTKRINTAIEVIQNNIEAGWGARNFVFFSWEGLVKRAEVLTMQIAG